MAMILKLLYLSISILAVSSNPYKRDDRTTTQIALKIRPLKETVESNTISQSQVKYSETQNNIINQKNKDTLLHNIWNLIEKAGNNLSLKPSNPQLFSMLTILIFHTYQQSEPNKHPEVVITEETTTKAVTTTSRVATTKEISTTTETLSSSPKAISTTEQYYDYEDDTGRPIKFVDTKPFDIGGKDKLSRKMPEVEHGSHQYAT
uniref:Uncharacterized protein n=1 Tax=Papilio xuthus TaxID=66420 RepID=I4DJN6_PAPXU|nr:unknown secreted protein [Papilio xuthus]